MILRIFKLGCFLALILVVAYLYHFNSQSIELVLGSERRIETRAAHAIVGLFLLGFLCASLFTWMLSIRHHFVVRRLKGALQKKDDHNQLLIQGRNYLALGDSKHAYQSLQKAVDKEPDEPLGRILLAEAAYRIRGAKEALEILERMRMKETHSAEALLRASELNQELGNQTAAFDNVALLLERVPGNLVALRQAVRAAAALQRFEEALELQQQLVQLSRGAEYDEAQTQLARLKVRYAIHEHHGDAVALQHKLERILKEHRDFPDALVMLAELEEAAGHRDTATKLRRKLFELSGESVHLETIARCWLAVDRPDAALAQVETAVGNVNGKGARIDARLFIAYLQLHLEMVEQARATLESVDKQLQELDGLARKKYRIPYAILQARLMRRDQDLATAFAYLVDTLDREVELPSAEDVVNRVSKGVALESWAERLSEKIQSGADA